MVTRFDTRSKFAHEIYDKLKKRFGELVCETRIAETVALATSPMHGKDVFAFSPHSPGAADYKALTKELWDSGFFAGNESCACARHAGFEYLCARPELYAKPTIPQTPRPAAAN